jgi:hypothetical protein
MRKKKVELDDEIDINPLEPKGVFLTTGGI